MARGGYGSITAAGRPALSKRPISQLSIVHAMIAPAHREGPHVVPDGRSEISAMYAKA